MSYELANDTKSLGQFASNRGYSDLIIAAESYTALAKFFDAGETDQTEDCVTELKQLAEAEGGGVAKTATALAKLLDGQEWVAITDGVTLDEEGPVEKQQSDAPGYRTSDGADTCSTCIHGGDGYCDLHKFSYASGSVCSNWLEMTKRFEAYTPPAEVQATARRGLELFNAVPVDQRAVDEQIILLGRDLSNSRPMHQDDIEFITTYFEQHQEDRFADDWPNNGPARQAWLCLGGRAGRSWARRVQRKMGEPGPGDVTMGKSDLTFEGQVVKADADRQLVFGWVSVVEIDGKPVKDLQEDFISPEEMESMAYQFVLTSRVAGEQHERVGVGKLIESMAFTADKQKALGIELGQIGWWAGFHISDSEVWQKIKDRKYTAFSIHGRGIRQSLKEP